MEPEQEVQPKKKARFNFDLIMVFGYGLVVICFILSKFYLIAGVWVMLLAISLSEMLIQKKNPKLHKYLSRSAIFVALVLLILFLMNFSKL